MFFCLSIEHLCDRDIKDIKKSGKFGGLCELIFSTKYAIIIMQTEEI